jgi:hypothetical protein
MPSRRTTSELVERLEGELRRHMERYGAVILPDAGTGDGGRLRPENRAARR